ncbi:endonuclease domain-containing protein [Azospirillum himalayense]|uniref:Endonuclease domain-containing protein n=1 Tax=Azospirillum himalayense TaxID=654847 RepID=A0ABW0FZF2_9PROT
MKAKSGGEIEALFVQRATSFVRSLGLAADVDLASALPNLCQSDIERRMLVELSYSPPWHDMKRMGEVVIHDHTMGGMPDRQVVMAPQYPVGRYRVDIGIIVNGYDGDRLLIAIECDGHDFHEKTKEQASRDKRRDRAFQKIGWMVFRFTGSDIFRKGEECADEVATFVAEWLDASLDAHLKRLGV